MARKKLGNYNAQFDVSTKRENIFSNSLADNSADFIVSGFGLKTFNHEQLKNLAKEVSRILKPGGSFSFIDVSVPTSRTLRAFYLLYLKYCIPILGR